MKIVIQSTKRIHLKQMKNFKALKTNADDNNNNVGVCLLKKAIWTIFLRVWIQTKTVGEGGGSSMTLFWNSDIICSKYVFTLQHTLANVIMDSRIYLFCMPLVCLICGKEAILLPQIFANNSRLRKAKVTYMLRDIKHFYAVLN